MSSTIDLAQDSTSTPIDTTMKHEEEYSDIEEGGESAAINLKRRVPGYQSTMPKPKRTKRGTEIESGRKPVPQNPLSLNELAQLAMSAKTRKELYYVAGYAFDQRRPIDGIMSRWKFSKIYMSGA